MRSDVVEFTQQMRTQGQPLTSLAGLLGLTDRTLRCWRTRLDLVGQMLELRGRPTRRAPRAVRQELLEVLDETGPGVSVATLRQQFPDMGRRELEDFLARYRRVWRCRHTSLAAVLRWPVPGAVWAMDFTQPPALIDGLYAYVLAVRDLASGQQLLAWPLADCGAASMLEALAWLFHSHGGPVVLKTDNGSAFRAAMAQAYLRQWGVTSLFSPPRTPRYNGSIEAGIGSLTMRAERLATHRGHPGVWTWDTLEAARREANATARPRGLGGLSPEEVWAARGPIESEARLHFQAMVECYREELLAATTGAGPGVKSGTDWGSLWTQREFAGEDRRAVSRALEACGYLLVSRRRIHLPIPGPKAARIS